MSLDKFRQELREKYQRLSEQNREDREYRLVSPRELMEKAMSAFNIKKRPEDLTSEEFVKVIATIYINQLASLRDLELVDSSTAIIAKLYWKSIPTNWFNILEGIFGENYKGLAYTVIFFKKYLLRSYSRTGWMV